MTLKEKIRLCEGANFWETRKFEKEEIPSMFMCDGPHGLRKQDLSGGTDMLGVNKSRPSTCFPAEVTTASCWDETLLKEIGEAIAKEAKAMGVGLVLGPGANLKRNPLCGRNFEYFSEDPYLAGKLAAAQIRGLEQSGVASSLKHFAANSQEKDRLSSDSVMDDRTLRELYLTAFEIAVKEGKPSTVMCAYPKLNGIHCSDHKELLTDILREEWGFDGVVISDWGAMNDRVEGFRAGCDLNMPGGSHYMEKDVLLAVKEGRLSEKDIDKSVERIKKLVKRAEENLKAEETVGKGISADLTEKNHVLARKAAEQGAVLLKNEDSILPLKGETKLAVVGSMARAMRYQGSGSSHIHPARLSQPLEFLPGAVYAAGCDERGESTEALLAEAAAVARQAEVAVVFAGLPDFYESEGYDREHMKMPEGHIRMIEAVANANPHTVVVLLAGAPVECPWADAVKTILYLGLPGQAGGEAAANLLYGRANPGGRLAESWPYVYEDCVSTPYFAKTKDALYLEGIYVGYRYYDKVGKQVRWPFGYGLSYTTFEYSDFHAEGNRVSVKVTNTGVRAGAEVVQLYLAPQISGVHCPVKELKGFRKLALKPGESKVAVFQLDERSFAIWQDGWRVQKGKYTICIGRNAQDLLFQKSIEVDGMELSVPKWQKESWYETCAGTPTQQDLEVVMGKGYKAPVLKKGAFTMDHSVEEMKEYSLMMKLLYRVVEAVIARRFGGKKDYENPEFRMLMACSAGAPLRSIQISAGIKGGVIPGLLEMANGHFFRGIFRMIRGR